MLEYLQTSEVELWTSKCFGHSSEWTSRKKVIVEPCSVNERILYNHVNAPMDTP